MTISDLPALNASLNAFSTIFIAAGWYLIRRGHWRRHIACMITAILSSTAFLVSYLIYHAHAGSVRFTATGIVRPIYYSILLTHVLLAFAVLPLVVITVIPVFRRRWDKHRRIARWAMPIWLYVSLTGVIVYLMLYRWFPADGLRQKLGDVRESCASSLVDV
jgi:putative membrane protein